MSVEKSVISRPTYTNSENFLSRIINNSSFFVFCSILSVLLVAMGDQSAFTPVSYSDILGVWTHKVISVVRSLVFRVEKQRGMIVTDVSGQPIRPIFKGPAVWTTGPLKMGRIDCPETPVTKYQFTPRNIPEERRSHLRRGGCLKSGTVLLMLVKKTCVRLCPTYDFWLTPFLASTKNCIERPRK